MKRWLILSRWPTGLEQHLGYSLTRAGRYNRQARAYRRRMAAHPGFRIEARKL